MPNQCAALQATGPIPQLAGALVASRGNRSPVPRVGHRPDRPGVPLQLAEERGTSRVGDVPEDYRSVAASRGKCPTVEREGYRLNPACVPHEVAGKLSP